MIKITIYCRYCNSNNLVWNGTSLSGKKRCRCKKCKKSFQLEYIYNACIQGIKEKIIDITMNGSGIRDTARILKINKNTVLSTIKKKQKI